MSPRLSQDVHLSIDAMGGDFGPRLCVPAALSFVSSYPQISITLVGDLPQIEAALETSGSVSIDKSRVAFLHAPQVVEPSEKAGSALRHKQQSSMWKSLELVSQGKANGCVSGGNTGALMAMSRRLIKTFSGINRPAICKVIPTSKNSSMLLDLGANLDCSAAQLVQFAIMGSALARAQGKSDPTVALLNVGSELTKGNDTIQDAATLMRNHRDIRFGGFIEGNNLFDGEFDVIVCDGFVGNVALKVSEGVATFIFNSLRAQLSAGLVSKIASGIVKPALAAWKKQINPSHYNGAALLGLKEVVVKSHGGADAQGFIRALEAAREQVEAAITDKIKLCLASEI